MPKLVEVPYNPFEEMAPEVSQPSAVFGTAKLMANKLFGMEGQERYQTWPEKMIRSGFNLPSDVLSGKENYIAGLRREDVTDIPYSSGAREGGIPGIRSLFNPTTSGSQPNDAVIERAQDTSGLMGTGGLVGPGGVALGSGPMLRPALKYKEKIYKAKEGQQHLDALPENLRDEFQQMALSGEDISHYNFGFMDHRGRFLQREDALKYAIDNGIVDPQDAKFGTLTSTMFADSGKPGAGMSALAKQNKQGFYSAVESAVDNIGQNKASGDQWLGTLSNQKGVKGEELEFTGLTEFLKGKQNVSKNEIQEYLKNNKVELGEVWKGFDKTTKEQALKDFEKEFERPPFGDAELINFAKKETKYQDYQLPGGENYRELLLTLPEKSSEATAKAFYDSMPNNTVKWEDLPNNTKDVFRSKADYKSSNYKSSHWDEPNILAHMRMNDRTIDGKKSLHLEEIQSDWLQSHRNETDKIKQALNKDFDTIAAKMVEAGIIKKICD